MKKTLEQEKQKRYAREIIQNKSNAYRQKLTDQCVCGVGFMCV
jgi:hypothetical protein